MVVLYGDCIIKSIMHSAATVHYEEVQDFRIYPIVQLHGCCTAIVSQDLRCSTKILANVSLRNNMVAVRCAHLEISSMSCKILECISIVQHGCCTALVSQNLQYSTIRVNMQQHGCRTVLLSQKYISTPCKILVSITFLQHGCRTYRHYRVLQAYSLRHHYCVLQECSLRNGNIMQIEPYYVVMRRESATSVYE